MSRTWRNSRAKFLRGFRNPRTYSQIRQDSALPIDEDLKDLPLAKRNRLFHRFIPTAWDDLRISSWDEGKHQ